MDQFFNDLNKKLQGEGALLPSKGTAERFGIEGYVNYRLVNEHGMVKQEGGFHNLVTSIGDMFCAQFLAFVAGATIGSVGYTTLGVSTIVPLKADTDVNSPITSSSRTWEGSYPQRVNSFGTGPGEWCVWRVSYPAGSCTNGSIGEIGMWTSVSSFVAHALIDPVVNKTANDTLQVDWGWKFLGT